MKTPSKMTIPLLIALLALAVATSLNSAQTEKQPAKKARVSNAEIPTEPRLRNLIGTWRVTASTFADVEKTKPMFVATETAGGRAIFSVMRQGNYEASSLWTFDAKSGTVRIFEVKSDGNVEHHVGGFDDAGRLFGEFRDPKTNELLRHTVMTWTDRDTITMDATFYVNGAERRHSLTMVRESVP